MKKDKFKYINNFPFIIMVAVAIILIILVNIYLNVKPDSVISFNGYVVLQGDTSYNLMNKYTVDESLDASAVQVHTGDYVYKQLDSYFVGVKEKQEIDFTYPAYSNDGITLYTINDDVSLIRNDFKKLDGYSGLSISYGLLYNIGDEEPIDNRSYFFLDLKNSIYVNTVSMAIQTRNNTYELTVNSPIYFNPKYINYYSFDGVSLKYNRIDDIYYDSIVKIGDYTFTYEEFLLKMGIIKLKVEEDDTQEEVIEKEEIDTEIENEIEDEIINDSYKKPIIELDAFEIGVYHINSNIDIIDELGVITSNPTFEIYDENNKLVLRKKITSIGDFNIKGLLPETKYHIVGKFSYRNEMKLNVENTFYEGDITTNSIDSLDPINLESEVGDRYSNKIEIKDLKILNLDNEALYGVNRITIKVDDVEYNVADNQVSSLKSGKATTISTPKKLKSNTLYNYEIQFYDKLNNELKVTGMYQGKVQTAKEAPIISVDSDIQKQNIDIILKTNNKDDVYIHDYKYELYSSSGYFIGQGNLNYEDSATNEINFSDLDYNTNYVLKISGIFDLEDGKGNQNLNFDYEFTIEDISNLTMFYDTDATIVTTNTISTDVYIENFSALERDDTEIYLYLADKDGNDIFDGKGDIKYINKYSITDLTEGFNSYKKLAIEFDNLNSGTEYQLKLKIVVKQLEQDIEIKKVFDPNIQTKASDAFVEIINSRLLGDTLDLYFKVKDADKKITENNIIIEIYEGEYDDLDDILGQKYIHRQVIELEEAENNYINFTLSDYNANSYTAFISANPYDKNRIKTYLEILNGDEESEEKNYALKVNREVKSSLEIYQQSEVNSKKMLTEINLAYYLSGSKIDFTLVDCADDVCKKIGNINADGSVENIDGVLIEDSTNNMLTYRGNKIDKRIKITSNKNEQHKVYLTAKKTIDEEKEFNLNNYYILSEIEFDTSKPIYNISNITDFYNISNKSNNYAVTADLDFYGNTKALTFYGTIDFQGYSLNLYENSESKSTLFNYLSTSSNKKAVLKNFVINYEIGFEGVKTDGYGFITYNYGTLENFIINVKQTNELARSNYLGLAVRNNYGKITNFVVYLNSSIDVYYYSGLVTHQTVTPGIVSNGYVAPMSQNYKIKTHDDSSRFGTFAYYNTGVVKNVYNLVDVEVLNGGYFGTIVYSSSGSKASVNNTLSVSHVTKRNENGPNVYASGSGAKASNNFYYDNKNLSFSNKLNQQINKSALRNVGVLEVILNSDLEKDFTVLSDYYPTVNMSNFMNDKQGLIPISFDYTQSSIEIISAEFISQNKEKGSAEIGVYISNPDKLDINSIDVENVSNETILSESYDESNQISKLILEIKLDSEDIAKSVYQINNFKYNNEIGTEVEKEYITNKPRIYVDMYKPIKTYSELVKSINANENIFLVSNIDYDGVSKVPNNVTYTALFDGNNKTLNLEGLNLPNGYFIYYVSTGSMKNLQVTNMNIDIKEKSSFSNQYIGFIRYSNQATLTNIDISNSSIKIEDANKIIYVGSLTGYAVSSTLNKISINNSIIDASKTYESEFSVGGMIGYQNSSSVQNSYVYNVDIKTYHDKLAYLKTVGGISGRAYSSSLSNSYAHGKINSNAIFLGGIIGFSNYGSSSTPVTNSYSMMELIGSTSNAYVGGVIGKSGAASNVKNNMFLGSINNLGVSNQSSTITSGAPTTTNYDLVGNPFRKTITYIEFDINDKFTTESSVLLPYLIESSFVEQSIKTSTLQQKTEQSYKVEYVKDNNLIQNKLEADSAYLYTNTQLQTTNYNKDNNLKIENITNDSIEYQYKYKLTPNNVYKSVYSVELSNNTQLSINLEFYRKINNWEDWKTISTTNAENIILLNDLNSNPNETNELVDKKLNNIVCGKSNGEKCKISGESSDNKLSITKPLIYSIFGTMNNVEFSNISVDITVNYSGVIGFNLGNITNCLFNDIEVRGKQLTGTIAFNNGQINSVELNNIIISGTKYVGGLIGYDYNYFSKLNAIKINNITVTGTSSDSYTGGVVGYVSSVTGSTNTLKNSLVSNAYITGTSYVGGLIGYAQSGITISDNIVEDSTIDAKNNYIGGVAGYIGGATNLKAKKVNIVNTSNTTAQYVGGVVGYSTGNINTSSSEDVIIGRINEDKTVNKMSAKSVGGITGGAHTVTNSYVRNSIISANENVGGILGIMLSSVYSVSGNTVSKTDILASSSNAGGLIGYYYASSYSSMSIVNNAIISNNEGGNYIQSALNAGGVVGYIKNDIDVMQNLEFENNFVENYKVFVTNKDNSKTAGGLIGRLYKVPNSLDKKFKTSFFYGTIDQYDQYGVGKIDNFSASVAYGNLTDEYNFSINSNFKQYVFAVTDPNSQMNNENNITYSTSFEKQPGLFPILINYNYKLEDSVAIPYSIESSAKRMLAFARRPMSNQNIPIDLDYEVYASDANKLNIEFSSIDESVNFFYEIGNYTSEVIPVNKRTFTITYDFKTPIKIYLVNSSTSQNKTYEVNDLTRKISIVNDLTYYIKNNILYSENSAIKGNFVNLYGNKVLSSDGTVYNLLNKTTQLESIDYNILPYSVPLYKFNYNGAGIETYYNYSVINGEVKNYQTFVIQNKLSIVDSSLKNKKDSYIIDFYNNKEIQLILNSDNKLYNLKGDINYPNNISNENIKDIYSDINSDSKLIVIEYESGEIYTFNYITGKEVFSNRYNIDMSFLQYVYNKLNSESTSNKIGNISNSSEYESIEKMKEKLTINSVEDAKNIIYETNGTTNNNKNYTVIYNPIVKKYNIYETTELLTNDLEITSENDEIYKDYELVQFYNNSNKTKENKSVSGILVFALTIISILTALYLLINRKRIRRAI